MNIVRASRELGESDNSIADIGATGDVGVEELTKEPTVGKSMFAAKGSMFRGAFVGTGERVHGRGGILWEGRDFVGGNGRGSIPAMGGEDALDVSATRKGDGGRRLLNVDTVVVVDEAEIFEWRCVFGGVLEFGPDDVIDFFGDVFVIAGEGKIVNLAQEENFVAFVVSMIDGLIMSGRLEV